jgi:hypothetical protein
VEAADFANTADGGHIVANAGAARYANIIERDNIVENAKIFRVPSKTAHYMATSSIALVPY